MIKIDRRASGISAADEDFIQLFLDDIHTNKKGKISLTKKATENSFGVEDKRGCPKRQRDSLFREWGKYDSIRV
jgi:hypothetical protein